MTRFAPSPTGPLHLGHAYSALMACEMAKSSDGRFLLRIEDLDQSRARPHWEAQIFDDLAWLGLDWPTPVLRQSDRTDVYEAALRQLADLDLLFPCRCRRRDIEAAAGAPQEGAPLFGPDGRIYPGTCRNRAWSERTPDDVVRINIAKAAQMAGPITFTETGAAHSGRHTIDLAHFAMNIGDVVLSRRDMAAAYHLAVVVDDAAQGVTHVIRGEDLFEATAIHVLLQRLLDLPTPTYHHHRLIRDVSGKRLAKRDDARSIARYREEGKTPADIRRMVEL